MPKIDLHGSISELETDDTFDWWAITHLTLESDLNQRVQTLSIERSAAYFRILTYAASFRSRFLILNSEVRARVGQAHVMRATAWYRNEWMAFMCAACFVASWWLDNWWIACLASAILGTLIFESIVDKRFSKLQRELRTKGREDLDALHIEIQTLLPAALQYFALLEVENYRGHLLAELNFKQEILAHIDALDDAYPQIQRSLL